MQGSRLRRGGCAFIRRAAFRGALPFSECEQCVARLGRLDSRGVELTTLGSASCQDSAGRGREALRRNVTEVSSDGMGHQLRTRRDSAGQAARGKRTEIR